MRRQAVQGLVKVLGLLWLVVGLVGCGRFDGDGRPKNLQEAKTYVESQVDAWCICYRRAQTKQERQAEETTRCMNLLPGAEVEASMTQSARLSSAEANELRSHTISYRRGVEANCR